MKKVLIGIVVLLVLVVGVGALALGLLLGGGGVAEALANVSIVRTDFDTQSPGGGFVAAVEGGVLNRGDIVRTDTNGRGYLTFFDGSTIEVEPEAQVAVAELKRESDGSYVISIEHTLGEAWINVAKITNPNSRWEIKTPAATATVRGTSFRSRVRRSNCLASVLAGCTTFQVDSGTVLVTGSGGPPQTLTPGLETTTVINQPAPPPTRIPPAPGLRVVAASDVDAIVGDPRGLTCGGGRAEIPRCSEGSVLIYDVVPGDYTITLKARKAGNVALQIEALFGDDVVGRASLDGNLDLGQIGRTTFRLALNAQRRPTLEPLAGLERTASVCGTETPGRVFADGTMRDRGGVLGAYAAQNRGRHAAFVVTEADLQAIVQDAVKGQPIKDITVKINKQGLQVKASVAAGPLTVPATAIITFKVSGGQLEAISQLVNVPGPVAEQINPRLAQGLGGISKNLPLVVERVSLRDGCLAIIGLTK